jgi:hypothetical protein
MEETTVSPYFARPGDHREMIVPKIFSAALSTGA